MLAGVTVCMSKCPDRDAKMSKTAKKLDNGFAMY